MDGSKSPDVGKNMVSGIMEVIQNDPHSMLQSRRADLEATKPSIAAQKKWANGNPAAHHRACSEIDALDLKYRQGGYSNPSQGGNVNIINIINDLSMPDQVKLIRDKLKTVLDYGETMNYGNRKQVIEAKAEEVVPRDVGKSRL